MFCIFYYNKNKFLSGLEAMDGFLNKCQKLKRDLVNRFKTTVQ